MAWDADGPGDEGLRVLIATATDTTARPAPSAFDESSEGAGGRWWSGAGLRGLRWSSVVSPQRLVAGLAVLVIVGALAGLVAMGGGGPAVDPALPVAGVDADGGVTDVLVSQGDRAGSLGGSESDATSDGGVVTAGSAAAGDEGPLVHVAGAVVNPGVHRLAPGARVHDALAAAGGPAPGADLDRLNLAAVVTDGSQVHVPLVGAAGAGLASGPGSGSATGRAGGATGGGGPVSLSTADAAALDALPGIGPATAAAIIAHREANGPFGSVEGLLEVRGIGEAKLDGLRDLVVP